ncbi:hypothetical protein [Tomitella cavernea]|uniref:Uncharacterized protein n=1 Tax=Tomitella cavernea TaxID=1387982 RepID=A0ABP9CY14_9ACTN|nr:hypothetical protein [Tomitella cavernea]
MHTIVFKVPKVTDSSNSVMVLVCIAATITLLVFISLLICSRIKNRDVGIADGVKNIMLIGASSLSFVVAATFGGLSTMGTSSLSLDGVQMSDHEANEYAKSILAEKIIDVTNTVPVQDSLPNFGEDGDYVPGFTQTDIALRSGDSCSIIQDEYPIEMLSARIIQATLECNY